MWRNLRGTKKKAPTPLTTTMEDSVLASAFQQMDCDGDGKINGDDLGRVFKHLDAGEIAGIIASIGNENGTVSWEQFSGAMRSETVDDDDLLGAFEMYDTNGDGKITLEELHNTLRGFGIEITTARVAVSLRNADKNSDGEIDFQEFRKLFHETTTSTIRKEGEGR